jgi:serine/threonine protein kinase
MVRLAYRRSDGMSVAVKTIAKHDALGLWSKSNRFRIRDISPPRDEKVESQQQLKRAPRLDEVDVLLTLKDMCPNVVQLLDVYETHHEVQLVLEYCEGGDLFECIKRRKQLEAEPDRNGPAPLIHGSFSEFETATVAKTLLNVLDILHSRNIVHRDIKPENILLVSDDDCMHQLGDVKLTDFGLARLLHDETDSSSNVSTESDEFLVKQRMRAYSRVGSDYYAAPEVHMGLGYDTPVDIYSLGVTLFVMLCGSPPSSTPFFKSDGEDMSDGDLSCVASLSEESSQSSHHSSVSELFPPELNISPLAQDLISKMLDPDPETRIGASEALNHLWIIHHSLQEDTHMMTHVTSKLSLSASNENLRPRTLSSEEFESILRIGPVLPVAPPGNSPLPKRNNVVQVGMTSPAMPFSNAKDLAITLTLAEVCNKLSPYVSDQKLMKLKRRRYHSQSHGDNYCILSSMSHSSRSRDSIGTGDKQFKKKRNVNKHKGSDHIDLSQASAVFAGNRIGRRFHAPLSLGFGS